MIKSNLEKEHIYHLYVVANIDARSRVTDLLNDALWQENIQTYILCHRQL